MPKPIKFTGYFPDPGCSEVWKLAEELLFVIKKGLDRIRHKFPAIETLL